MLFNSGNLSLVSRTRTLAGNPASEPSDLYATQDIQDAINLAYEELWNKAKRAKVGWGVEESYCAATAGEVFFEPPNDIDGSVLSVTLQEEGLDLSSAGVTGTILHPKDGETAQKLYESGDLTSPRYFFFQDALYGIVSPPEVTGGNAIRIRYQQELTHLSADEDEPKIPQSYHDLICLLAAMDLRVSKDLSYQDVASLASRKYPDWIEFAQEPIEDLDDQMTAVGRSPRSFHTKSGFIKRY